VFNQHNPWWLVMPDIATYLQRVSWLLRQGQPANDVAVYLPTHDAYAQFTLGRASINQAMDALLGPNMIPQILDAGYNFDFTDDGAIMAKGVTHRILLLPGVQRIPLATYRKIDEFARRGGTVIATGRLPSMAPGLREAETDTPRIQELSHKLPLTGETKLGEALHAALAADVTAPDGIGVVHRKLAFADVYFLANTTNHAVKGPASFRITGLNAAWWNPFTGKVTGAGGNKIDLDLAPYESRVLLFSRDAVAPEVVSGPRKFAPADLSTGWKVTFSGASQPIQMSTLRSWTEDEARKYYSGQATYDKTITLPPVEAGQPVCLEFGEGTPVAEAPERRPANGMRAMLESPVREAAMVYVNNNVAGAVWRPPYEVEVSSLLRAGGHAIRIVVANTALNVLAKGPLPDYKALTAKYGERFQAQDMNLVQALPSGILGPVRLVGR
jgi:hypothetical protein